jgi:stage IV sporulation protein FB
MQWSNGYLTLGHPTGVPVRVHWTLPLGAVFFSRFTWSPGFWFGFFLLILAHEMGHALLVKACRGTVVEVLIHGIGGECRHLGGLSELQGSIIAWGGVLAQLVLLIGALVYRTFLGASSPFMAQLLAVWIDTNLTLIAINLLPIAPLDGAAAWRLPKLLHARRKRAPARPKLRVIQGQKRDDRAWSDDKDPPPMPDALKKEIDRITREALRDARRDKN